MDKGRIAALIFFVTLLSVISGCSSSHKITASVSGTDDPYALRPSDTASIEIPEDAIVVKPEAYQPSFTIINDLVHTKLDVKFDWEKRYLYGKAWITLKPHFYDTDSLRLDAKGFDIHKIEMVGKKGNTPLTFTYDSLSVKIDLGKTYHRDEEYTIYMDYTARPNEIEVQGSEAIQDARGLYFINHDGKDPSKPRQLWTQGETESNSCWFPTIDKPIMKMTTELSMTVENGFVSLSNGTMTSSKDNKDGTHTDTWTLDLPYAPYLVMMAAGPFAVVKDHYKNMEVNYYIDKNYEPYARDIFGHTPEMIDFFSKKLDVPYAWPKYSQVVVHDFVSGAMENVTATVYFDKLNQTRREMIDGSREDIISHELFHQWFGDLVTCESWSNVSLNESFATYGQYLWNEYKYGKDRADYGGFNDLNTYLYQSKTTNAPLTRYYYENREDLFDAISYHKGGRVLNMLRNYVGDDAFFQSLKKYLDDNRFSTGEVHQLRLAFEKVTGQDLNWFFNEWFLSKGHPVLDISYHYDAAEKVETVKILQLQKTDDGIPIFTLPLKVDVYSGGKVTRHNILVNQKEQEFSFASASAPDLVNVDADKSLVCEKSDNKTDTAFAFQTMHAPLFMDRLEALQYFEKDEESQYYGQVIKAGMNDRFWVIRGAALDELQLNAVEDADKKIRQQVLAMASADSSSHVRASAIEQMSRWNDISLLPQIEKSLFDSSYLVIATALDVLFSMDSVKAYQSAAVLENDSSEEIVRTLTGIYARMGGPEKNNYFLKQLKAPDLSYITVAAYGQYLARYVNQQPLLEKGIPALSAVAMSAPKWYVRFAAVNAMQNIYTAMESLQEDWKNSSQAQSQEVAGSETLGKEMASLEEKIREIQAAETDENLKSMYQHH